MLSIQRVKELIDDQVSDEEAMALRAACYELAGIIIDHWIDQCDREASESAKEGDTAT